MGCLLCDDRTCKQCRARECGAAKSAPWKPTQEQWDAICLAAVHEFDAISSTDIVELAAYLWPMMRDMVVAAIADHLAADNGRIESGEDAATYVREWLR